VNDNLDTPDLSLTGALNLGGLGPVAEWLDTKAPHEIAEELTRLNPVQSALVWRMLARDEALEVFEELDSFQQQQLLSGMRDTAFRDVVEEMDPDDRARLLGEAPAGFVRRVLAGLSHKERSMTASLLGFPDGSVGRVMSPEVVTVPESTNVSDVLDVVRRKGSDAETIDLLAVVDKARKLIGVIGLSHVVLADQGLTLGEIADRSAPTLSVTEDAEKAARLVQETNRWADGSH
jgi:Mg/Co/Ni transporter MgtE (contains CBS domain)